jgi:dephospho-CoA kinase
MSFKYAIALTGGIATGKSTVISLLSMSGVSVIDADKVAHQKLKEHRIEIGKIFGDEYLTKDNVNRPKLGELIFSNSDAKQQLEEFIHPKIFDEISQKSDKLDKLQFPYLIDIPLFFENKRYDISKIVVVYAPKEMQLQRLIKRNNFTETEALSRINSQIDIEEKRAKATFVINNSQDLTHLSSECEQFVQYIKQFN